MSNFNPKKSIVLTISGHDPSGGAGIQADIESIANAGCHPVSVITSLTAQNTKDMREIIPQNPDSFQKQIKLILEDMKIDACKIGMIGDARLIDVICSELTGKDFPIVLDPIIHAGTGYILANENVYQKMIAMLAPITTLITPNSVEAKLLTKTDNLNIAAETLIKFGSEAALITGTHERTTKVINTLYLNDLSQYKFEWQRLSGTFHGSGCTLSSRIAAHLAQGEDMQIAVEKAQQYTWQTLKHGVKLGHGQLMPNRFF